MTLTTSTKQKAAKSPIRREDLNRAVFAWREALQDPRADARPAGKQLYDILLGPIDEELRRAKAVTLMLSLDGTLRYLPFAALWDGEKYFVERYRTVVFTPSSEWSARRVPSVTWTALGLGVSLEHQGFSALPNAKEELAAIVRDDKSGTTGVLPGTLKVDEAFTEASLRTELRKRYPVVHIASHFAFRPGRESDSFLLLGDGNHLTLSKLNETVDMLQGVDLLTLSACDTAMGGVTATGKEVEGFGVMAQKRGAKAILASLWAVDDASTRYLMEDFYVLRTKGALSTSEALRQAQLHLLHGAKGKSGPTRGIGVRLSVAASTPSPQANDSDAERDGPYAHPYYWAPFIVIGDGR